MQESKQEVIKVVSLIKMAENLTKVFSSLKRLRHKLTLSETIQYTPQPLYNTIVGVHSINRDS